MRNTPPVAPINSPVYSILVLTKHRFMGDTVVAVPLLRATRAAFPDARITLLTGPFAASVLQHCPYVDQILQHSSQAIQRGFYGSLHLSGSVVRHMAMLRRAGGGVDVCLLPDRSLRAAIAALMCGARVRAGFDSEGRGPLLTHPVRYDGERREAECHLDILRAILTPHAVHDNAAPELWVTTDERERGAEILATREAVGDNLVGIQPGASHDWKQWEPERFARIADALRERGAGIVLLGAGASERAAAQRMCRAMRRADVVDLTDQTTIREMMGVLSHLCLFVGNDTGVNHIAAGLGVPTVALFGPTPAHKWGNPGPRNAVIAAPDGDLSRLDPAPVLEAAFALLRIGRAIHCPTQVIALPNPTRQDAVQGLAR